MTSIGGESDMPPPGMSEEVWQKHQEITLKIEEERRLRFENELKNNPPLPPWLKYPDYSRYDIFWRMGTGEGYLDEYVYTYFKHASADQINEYKRNYPEPEEWKGWYE